MMTVMVMIVMTVRMSRRSCMMMLQAAQGNGHALNREAPGGGPGEAEECACTRWNINLALLSFSWIPQLVFLFVVVSL